MIMDAFPALIILMPILVPVGACLYVACGITRPPIEAVIRPLIPFLLVLITTLLVISYVPEIALFLPR